MYTRIHIYIYIWASILKYNHKRDIAICAKHHTWVSLAEDAEVQMEKIGSWRSTGEGLIEG